MLSIMFIQVENSEDRDEMPYGSLPQTEFQKMIRLSRNCKMLLWF